MRPKAREASQRLLAHRWIAESEAQRARRRHMPLSYEEALAAAMVGLWLADSKAPAGQPASDFGRAARRRCRHAIIDHLRSAVHGSRYGGEPGSTKPWQPEPESVAFAEAAGLLPRSQITYGGVELVDPQPDAEQAFIEKETAAANAALLASVDMPARWRLVLERRLAGHQNADIARDFGVSTMRTSEIFYAALARIRKARV
jgi:hypothetical protein